MNVCVKISEEEFLAVSVSTMDELRGKILAASGIPKGRLRFDEAMSTQRVLVLRLAKLARFHVNVLNPPLSPFVVELPEDLDEFPDAMADAQELLARRTGIPVEEQTIFRPTENRITLERKPRFKFSVVLPDKDRVVEFDLVSGFTIPQVLARLASEMGSLGSGTLRLYCQGARIHHESLIDTGMTLHARLEHAPLMTVFVRTMDNKTLSFTGLLDDLSVAGIKEKIEKLHGIPGQMQKLVFAGKQLDDSHTLAEYNIADQTTLHLVLRFGEKKKKRSFFFFFYRKKIAWKRTSIFDARETFQVPKSAGAS
jgi:large subunit ribosomal protein L40e